MKIAMKRLIRDEKGAALMLALILLLIGGLISAALLNHMGSGILAGEVHERRTAELYAADAGVEDALWRIQNQVDEVKGLTQCYQDWTYNITDADGGVAEVNDRRVEVTITLISVREDIPCDYRIVSRAIGDGSGTQVEAYVTSIYGDLSGILDQVITSREDYVLQGPITVDPPEGAEHGPVKYYDGDWPKASDLAGWYWQDVKDEDSYELDNLDVEEYTSSGIGPFCRNGTLDIVNRGTAGLTLSLNGTVYITGDTKIGKTAGGHSFYLDLNGHTIFIESNTIGGTGPGGPYALQIGAACTITGSGCIIAVGDIEFKPNLECSPTDYVLVLSIEGQTYMQPGGDFYGTLAGMSEVYMQNGEACWTNPYSVDGGLNFPGFAVDKSLYYSIASWEISQQ